MRSRRARDRVTIRLAAFRMDREVAEWVRERLRLAARRKASRAGLFGEVGVGVGFLEVDCLEVVDRWEGVWLLGLLSLALTT